jgi:tRNA(Ile)-lysidine synthase
VHGPRPRRRIRLRQRLQAPDRLFRAGDEVLQPRGVSLGLVGEQAAELTRLGHDDAKVLPAPDCRPPRLQFNLRRQFARPCAGLQPLHRHFEWHTSNIISLVAGTQRMPQHDRAHDHQRDRQDVRCANLREQHPRGPTPPEHSATAGPSACQHTRQNARHITHAFQPATRTKRSPSRTPYHRLMPAARPTPHPASLSGVKPGRISRRDPAVLHLALAWRDLTGGRARGQDLCRRTLLACSGGGDSVGLALGLAAAVSKPRGIFTIAHIVHDLRPREEALADRDTAAALADTLGLPFAEATIAALPEGGNAEAAARRLRYQALAVLAREHRCHFIATAHHAQDQFESILMALLRGSGTRGLRGIAPSRMMQSPPGKPIRLIRPALDLDTADLRRFCTKVGITWADDATNRDTTRLRAALRHQIIPQLEELRPGAARRAARAARHIAAAQGVVGMRVLALLGRGGQGDERGEGGDGGEAMPAAADALGELAWPRESLRCEPPIVLGGLLRRAAAELAGRRGQDRLGARTLDPIIRALRDHTTDPRVFPLAGLVLTIDARRVMLTCKEC